MQLKQDFIDILKVAPAIPSTSTKETFKLMEHIKLNTDNNFWNLG